MYLIEIPPKIYFENNLRIRFQEIILGKHPQIALLWPRLFQKFHKQIFKAEVIWIASANPWIYLHFFQKFFVKFDFLFKNSSLHLECFWVALENWSDFSKVFPIFYWKIFVLRIFSMDNWKSYMDYFRNSFWKASSTDSLIIIFRVFFFSYRDVLRVIRNLSLSIASGVPPRTPSETPHGVPSENIREIVLWNLFNHFFKSFNKVFTKGSFRHFLGQP